MINKKHIGKGLLKGLARGLGLSLCFYAGYALGHHQSDFTVLGCALLGYALVNLPDNISHEANPKDR